MKEIFDIEGGSIEDYSAPLFIAWQINTECNVDCLHCCEEAGYSMPDALNTKKIKSICEQIVELYIPYVALSGGEPLLHKDFKEVCEYLRKNKVSLKVETNGMLIDENYAKWFGELGFRSVQVSLDGATAEIFQSLRKHADFKVVVKAIQLLVKYGVITEIVFVPTKFNIYQTPEVIDLAYKLGVWGFYTGKIMRIGRAAENWEILCPTEKQYEFFFEVLKEKTKEYEGKMKIYYYPYDVIEELKFRLRSPSASLLLLPNGKVKIIGPLPFVCADLRKHSLIEAWQRYKIAWKLKEVKEFTKKVIENPVLLKEANRHRELYIIPED